VAARVLVIDNYDSFVYNLVQYLGELGAEPVVVRHDEVDLDGVRATEPDAVLISPGPGRPEDAGVSNDVLRSMSGSVPILGVCLGHQCIGQAFGGRVVRAPKLFHGKASDVHHEGAGLMAVMPPVFPAGRYHSLVVEREGLPADLEVTAWTTEGVVMGLRHRTLDVEGVQFHPESILTQAGRRLLGAWLARCGHDAPEPVMANEAGG
jgi:anthranilate synthase/aminodeoxychorismate synthase-like glutamine amidotransferase